MKVVNPKEMEQMSTLELKHYHDALTENVRVAWHLLRYREATDDA